MRCPYCGAETTAQRCEYCDSDISYIYTQNNISETTERNSFSFDETAQNTYTEVPFPSPAETEKYSNKKKSTVLLLCIFLGWLGVHHFYTGKWVWGLIYLFTHGFYGIGVVIDLVMIATDKYKDGKKQKLLP